MITLSTHHLSADGARASTQENDLRTEVTPEAAVAVLQAFASVPTVDLAGLDARIHLHASRQRFAVQNSQGKLLMVLMPELLNTWEECTPGQVVARLLANDTTALAPTVGPDAAEELSRPAPGPGLVRQLLGSRLLLGILAVAAAVLGWWSFSPEIPDGVSLIRDDARIGELHREFNGRYGTGEQPGQTVLVLDGGQYRSYQVNGAGAPDILLAERNYHYGLRAGHVVLVLDNGAIFEARPGAGLRFLESVYVRQSRTKS